MTPYKEWPGWLQTLVVAPHGILLAILVWIIWPKSKRQWRKCTFVFAYLPAFYLVMHFCFGF